MSKPMISVVIPVYNAEKYLEDCIESILVQSFTDWELILVDDGSKDHSNQLCKKYAGKYEAIHLIEQENQGVSTARNVGAAHAKGQYLCFVDSDDYIEKDALKEMYEAIAKEQSDIVIAGMKRIYKRTVSQYLSEKQFIKGKKEIAEFVQKNYLTWMISSPCSKLYRSSIASALLFDKDICLGEDLKYNIQFFEMADKISVIDSPTYCYRDSDGSLTKKYRSGHYKAICDIYDITQKYIEKTGLKSTSKAFENVNFKMFSFCTAFMYQNISNVGFREERKFIKEICENEALQNAITNLPENMRTDQKLMKILVKNKLVTIIHIYSMFKFMLLKMIRR